MKIRMERDAKEILKAPEWTIFEKGREYDVPDRIAKLFIGAGHCKRVEPVIEAKMNAGPNENKALVPDENKKHRRGRPRKILPGAVAL